MDHTQTEKTYSGYRSIADKCLNLTIDYIFLEHIHSKFL
jgi:hypothetical protein